MTPRLLNISWTQQDCLITMAREGLILVRQEDLDTNAGQMNVIRYAWDVIAAMPDLVTRHYWLDVYADSMYARYPWIHREWFRGALVDGVAQIRVAKGLPV